MVPSFQAELLKLCKRPAVWVLGLVLVLSVILLGYVILYSLVLTANQPENFSASGATPQQLKQALFPENVLSVVLPLISSPGGPIALILGALVAGSEYSWGTLKTALIQRPSRLGILSGKLVALGVILAVFVLSAFATGAIASFVVVRLEDAPVEWPVLKDLVRATGAAWLILTTWAAFGLSLATLFRSTALAIGLGLVYSLVLENLTASLPVENQTFEAVRQVLLGQNSNSLANSFNSTPGVGQLSSLVEPERATVTLAAYAVGFILLATLLFRHRNVTS